jgi:hypothetical protein
VDCVPWTLTSGVGIIGAAARGAAIGGAWGGGTGTGADGGLNPNSRSSAPTGAGDVGGPNGPGAMVRGTACGAGAGANA